MANAFAVNGRQAFVSIRMMFGRINFLSKVSEQSISDTRHPFCSSKVRVVAAPSGYRVGVRIQVQDEPGSFLPCRASSVAIQQLQIDRQVRPVIVRDVG